jgi:Flp pilus assembly protein TadG
MKGRRVRGQAMVEWAITISLLVIIVIGGVQLLQGVYLTRNVRAAAEDAVELAAVHGGDTEDFRAQLPDVLATYRLDPDAATVVVSPTQGSYLQPITVRVDYRVTIRVYGVFDMAIPSQEARALSQKDWGW